MRSRPSFRAGSSLRWTLLATLVAFAACSDQTPVQPPADDGQVTAQAVGAAIAAQEAHTPQLMSNDNVVGTAVGRTNEGKPAVVVYLLRGGPDGLPAQVDGIPVVHVVTGMFVAGADETSRARPAPIGFSVGHPDITAGTIGARVTDGSGGVYVLSNNHVLASSNQASIGDPTLQPGPSDGGTDPDDRIGTLADYEPIDFENDNVMDAAIASTTTDDVGFATASDEGYGTPGTSVTSASVGMAVQKYGRTTGHTTGEVAETNVTISVCYETRGPFQCASAATFTGQIAISPGSFSDGGDSGSLIVTDGGNANPVGLLFAGSDTRTIANPIGPVLDRFGVDIDDGSGDDGGDTNNPPTASFTASCTDLGCDFDGSGSSDSDGSIASYDWDFGDGNTGSGETVSHSYASGGTYTVTLTVTDDGGATDASSQNVTVSEPDANSPPTASFTASCTDLGCDFDGSGSSDSDGSIASYDWDFGDGNTGSGESVSHSYASGGTYSVTLTVTDDDGATDASSQDVTVEEATSSDITLSASGQKVRGVRTVDLSWNGATSEQVDVVRDGSIVATIDDAGSYTDDLGRGGGGTFTYQVCEAGTSTCSNEASVSF